MPTIGSDKAEIATIAFSKLTTDPTDLIEWYANGDLNDHDIITIELNLFHDNLPKIADGDLDMDNKEIASRYEVIFGPGEFPPVIVQQQQNQNEDGVETREAFEKALKHRLTDPECVEVLNAVKSLDDAKEILT